jgi:hypothetical protein
VAITQAALTSGTSATNATSYATASISPTANRLIVVAVHSPASTAANAAAPSGISGAGLTFVKLVDRANTAFGTAVSLWRAMDAAPSTGALTITFANQQERCAWSVFEFDGVDTGGSNGSAAVNSNTASATNAGTTASATATLAAFAGANNGAVMATGFFDATGVVKTCTPDTGWTEIHDLGLTEAGNRALSIETQWRADNDTTAVGTWSANGGVLTVAAELVAASTGGISADCSFTEQGDTIAAGAALAIAASSSTTEQAESVAATGALPVSAEATLLEEGDSLSAAGAVANAAASSTADGAETVGAAAASTIMASAVFTEASEALAADATIGAAAGISAAASFTEEGDAVVATGTVSQPPSPAVVTGGRRQPRAQVPFFEPAAWVMAPPGLTARGSFVEEDDSVDAAASVTLSARGLRNRKTLRMLLT